MGRRSALERLAHLFRVLYRKLRTVGLAGNYRRPLPLTQVDQADAPGLTPVHGNRVLKATRGRTLITLRSSTLVVEA